MPKNKGKGGKNRRRGKNENEFQKRELIFKEDGQEYAQVLKMLGNGRLEAQCFDGPKRMCNIRGKLRKKVWINTGDIILISLRDYQDAKADVLLKYYPEEARTLKSYGELPDNVNVMETTDFTGEDQTEVEFKDAPLAEDGEDEAGGAAAGGSGTATGVGGVKKKKDEESDSSSSGDSSSEEESD